MGRKGERASNALPMEFYFQIAYEYRTEVEANGTRGAAKAVAERRSVPVPKVNTWIKAARREGLLEPYSARVCHLCRQPLVPEADGENMETLAGDFAQKCRELNMPKAAIIFDRAAETLSKYNG